MKGKCDKVLVTGGSGFIGTNLIEALAQAGHQVLSIDKRQPRNSAHESLFRSVDVMNLEDVKSVFEEFQPDLVVHLAARTDLEGTSGADYIENTLGTDNIIRAVNANPCVKRTIFTSSRLVCKIGYTPVSDEDFNADTPYGLSKAEMERRIRAHRISSEWVIIRPTSIWGPWFEVPYRTFFDTIRRGVFVMPKGLEVRKSFGFVGNSVYQISKLLHAPSELILGRTMYLCDPDPLNLSSWSHLIQEQLAAPPIRMVSISHLQLAARVGDIAKRFGVNRVPLTSFRLQNLITDMVYDSTPISQVAGTLPYSLEDGVRETVKWLRTQ